MLTVLAMLAAVGGVGLSDRATDPHNGGGRDPRGGGYSSYDGGLDPTAPPTHGEVYLSAGFEDDPFVVAVQSGGPLDASHVGGWCRGMVSEAPTIQLTYEAGDYPLWLFAGSYGDVTLVVYTPEGDWVCDDDSGGENDAELYFSRPLSGVYDIWIGAYDGESVDAQLAISERD